MTLVNGLIQAGNSCPYILLCTFKYNACNGNGCPFLHNKIVDHDISCGLARFFILTKENKAHKDE